MAHEAAEETDKKSEGNYFQQFPELERVERG
jgi:hypothetical protein